MGASDSAAILGVSKWGNALSVYMEKEDLSEPEEHDWMKWGKRLEPAIIEAFNDEGELVARPSGDFLISARWPWMHANLDATISYANAKMEPVEIKFSVYGDEWAGDVVPDYYLIQIQHQMAVTDADLGHVVCWIPGRPLKHFVVERDEETIEWIVRETEKFWCDHMRKHIPPAVSELTFDQVRAMYPRAVEDTMILPGWLAPVAGVSVAARAFIKLCEKAKEKADAMLMSKLGVARRGVVGSYQIDWRNGHRTSLDQKALKRDHPEIFEQYMRPVVYRSFYIKEVDENPVLQEKLGTLARDFTIGGDDEGAILLLDDATNNEPSGSA